MSFKKSMPPKFSETIMKRKLSLKTKKEETKMKKVYRTFLELVPAAVEKARGILEENGVNYLLEYNEEYHMYWLLFMTDSYEIPAAINKAIGIRGKLDGREVPA